MPEKPKYGPAMSFEEGRRHSLAHPGLRIALESHGASGTGGAAVFQMNDWLLDVQQWDSAPHPDCRGRFYDPDRPFGPPHASSTAVYLEGLADAFAPRPGLER